MSKIVGVIPLQNYELIRNKIAEIIAIELENQFVISYDPDFDCNVWLERTTPFDQTEMTPAVINVSFIDGNYQNEDVKDADGVYSYAVDVYSRGYTNDENIGDTRAALIVQKVIGKIRAILMATVYKTVDTGLGIVKNRRVVSVQVYDPKRHPQGDDSTTFDQAGRLTFQVTAIETVEVLTPNMIQGSDTWVRWCCTDKGYVWINDGQTNGTPGNPHVCPPIPPTPPLGPYLRTVAVDGVTITGDGTPSDPLVAIGGGGGTTLTTKNEGSNVSTNTTTLNFTGEGVTASLTSPGIVEVNIEGGSGTPILLQTDGVNNGSQSILNLKEGSNITVTDDGSGGVTITASGGGLPQVNSDWNATSGVAEILNKPTIPILPATIVEDVTATLPIASSGGATPNISITQSDASTDGYLSSTDWNTFDGKFDVPTGTNADYLDGTGTPTAFPTIPTGTVTSVDLTMPAAFSVTGNPITTSGTLAVAAAGVATQYIRGDGQLANFPTTSGGGASVSYYLNGSVSQGTFGGVAMREINKTPIIGAGTDFTINVDGYIQSFITDANDPNQLSIPAGNWTFETYFSANNNGGNPRFYIELYKWDGAALTLIASNSTNPEKITGGTAIDLYLTALAVPQTTLAATDRIAVRFYVIHSGRTITMHTEDNHLSQVITTFSTGLTALNGLTDQVQLLATGTSGTDFTINSTGSTHTFNIPSASALNRGLLLAADWTIFNNKVSTTRSISTTSPLSGGGDLSADRTLSIADAAADGSTKGAAAFTAADFNAASGVISIDYTNGQAASSVNKGFLTAADWTTFNNKGGSTYKSVIDTTPVTGTTTNTKVFAQLVPANTFAIGDIIQIKARLSKVGVAGLMTLRVYVNTADSLTVPAATLISTTVTATNSQLNFAIDKSAAIKSSTVTQTQTATNSGLYQDPQTATTALTNSNIDWTVNQYIIFAIQNGASGDSTVMTNFQIIKL